MLWWSGHRNMDFSMTDQPQWRESTTQHYECVCVLGGGGELKSHPKQNKTKQKKENNPPPKKTQKTTTDEEEEGSPRPTGSRLLLSQRGGSGCPCVVQVPSLPQEKLPLAARGCGQKVKHKAETGGRGGGENPKQTINFASLRIAILG